MKDEEPATTLIPVNNMSTTKRPVHELLVGQRKKLGSVATKAFSEIRHFLYQEITLPPAEKILQNFSLQTHLKTKKKKTRDEVNELKKLVTKSHEVLASARTVFPMRLFPHIIVLDRTKITITRRDFLSADIMSIQIEDVLNVAASVGPLFGSLTIASRVMSSVDHFTVNYLWRNDAMHIKRMIQGYVAAKNSGMDLSKLSRQEMVEALHELGHDANR